MADPAGAGRRDGRLLLASRTGRKRGSCGMHTSGEKVFVPNCQALDRPRRTPAHFIAAYHGASWEDLERCCFRNVSWPCIHSLSRCALIWSCSSSRLVSQPRWKGRQGPSRTIAFSVPRIVPGADQEGHRTELCRRVLLFFLALSLPTYDFFDCRSAVYSNAS